MPFKHKAGKCVTLYVTLGENEKRVTHGVFGWGLPVFNRAILLLVWGKVFEHFGDEWCEHLLSGFIH